MDSVKRASASARDKVKKFGAKAGAAARDSLEMILGLLSMGYVVWLLLIVFGLYEHEGKWYTDTILWSFLAPALIVVVVQVINIVFVKKFVGILPQIYILIIGILGTIIRSTSTPDDEWNWAQKTGLFAAGTLSGFTGWYTYAQVKQIF